MKLNLGSCSRSFPGYLDVDIVPPADIIADLSAPWPWPDSSVEAVKAFDVFEHIGNCEHVNTEYLCFKCLAKRCGWRVDGKIVVPAPGSLPLPLRHWSGKAHVMNELWRVLQPGGRAELQIPDASQGDGGFCDPTHVSYWTSSDFEYYSVGIAERERFRSSSYYGVKADFKVLSLEKTKHVRHWGGFVVEMQIVLEAVK